MKLTDLQHAGHHLSAFARPAHGEIIKDVCWLVEDSFFKASGLQHARETIDDIILVLTAYRDGIGTVAQYLKANEL